MPTTKDLIKRAQYKLSAVRRQLEDDPGILGVKGTEIRDALRDLEIAVHDLRRELEKEDRDVQ